MQAGVSVGSEFADYLFEQQLAVKELVDIFPFLRRQQCHHLPETHVIQVQG
jgi:hypothetical protein